MIEFTDGIYKFYVYILTNRYRTTFYIGVSNNLNRRLKEHHEDIKQGKNSFVARYNLSDLVYYERYGWIQLAIAREKEIKSWRREKKLNLIRSLNPKMKTLNYLFE